MSFEKLTKILIRNGYQKVITEISEAEIVEMIREELSTGDLDIKKSYNDNEEQIKSSFYSKNWVSINVVFSESDIEELYNLIQQLLTQ